MAGAFRSYLPHLRLPFQLTLAPIFLWGALLSGGGWIWETFAAFVSLHLFLYPAATAFNSAYDKDEGPVVGMEAPPPVPQGLLPFSIALGAAGILFAIPAGVAFLGLYALAAGWTAAYSHPATRWKSGPLSSALAIGLGQGVVGFLAGWAAASPLDFSDPLLLPAAASAAFTAVGLYPATQVFQVAEDRARGDRTLAVTLGPARALRLGAALLLVGGVLAAWAASRRFGPWDAGAVAFGYLVLALWQLRLSARIGGPDLYRRAMKVVNAGTAGFLLYVLVRAL